MWISVLKGLIHAEKHPFFPFLLHSLITVSMERLLTSTCSANRLEILNIDITIFDGMINNLTDKLTDKWSVECLLPLSAMGPLMIFSPLLQQFFSIIYSETSSNNQEDNNKHTNQDSCQITSFAIVSLWIFRSLGYDKSSEWRVSKMFSTEQHTTA